jgi:hypothetical protein
MEIVFSVYSPHDYERLKYDCRRGKRRQYKYSSPLYELGTRNCKAREAGGVLQMTTTVHRQHMALPEQKEKIHMDKTRKYRTLPN